MIPTFAPFESAGATLRAKSASAIAKTTKPILSSHVVPICVSISIAAFAGSTATVSSLDESYCAIATGQPQAGHDVRDTSNS